MGLPYRRGTRRTTGGVWFSEMPSTLREETECCGIGDTPGTITNDSTKRRENFTSKTFVAKKRPHKYSLLTAYNIAWKHTCLKVNVATTSRLSWLLDWGGYTSVIHAAIWVHLCHTRCYFGTPLSYTLLFGYTSVIHAAIWVHLCHTRCYLGKFRAWMIMVEYDFAIGPRRGGLA